MFLHEENKNMFLGLIVFVAIISWQLNIFPAQFLITVMRPGGLLLSFSPLIILNNISH